MRGAISLHEALSITEDTTRPFSMKWVAFDEARKKGGELIELDAAVRVGASHDRKANDTVVVRRVGGAGHPYTVHTHLILEVNNQPVFI